MTKPINPATRSISKDEVLRLYSLAMKECQLFEIAFKALLLCAHLKKGDLSKIPYHMYETATLGQLIKLLLDLCPEIDLRTQLHAARDARNWLAHRFFTERETSLETCVGRCLAVERIGEEITQLVTIRMAVIEVVGEFLEELGKTIPRHIRESEVNIFEFQDFVDDLQRPQGDRVSCGKR